MAYREAQARIAARLRGCLGRRVQVWPDELEDLVQETLLALHLPLHLQRGTWDPTLTVSAWVLAIARHKRVDLWRRRGRRDAAHVPLDDADEGLLIEGLLMAVADERDTHRDLAQLPGALPDAHCPRRSVKPSC